MPGTSLAKKSVCLSERNGMSPTSTGIARGSSRCEESLERREVVDRLGLRERGAGLDLGAQLRELDLEVRGGGIGRAADREGARRPDRVAGEVGAGVQAAGDPEEPEDVHLRDLLALRIVADLERVASEAEHRLEAEARGSQQIRLQAEHVAVARRDLDDRLEAGLPLDERRHGDRGHPQPGHRVVGDVDRVHAGGARLPRRLDGAGGVDALRRLDLRGHDEGGGIRELAA